MIYVLDTDMLSLLGQANSNEAPRIRRRVVSLPADDAVVTTIVNYEEQMRGWMAALAKARSQDAEIRTYEKLHDHLITFRRLTVLKYTPDAAELLRDFRARRVRVGTMDLKIAAITVANNAVLVTRNCQDFAAIAELRIEDWSKE